MERPYTRSRKLVTQIGDVSNEEIDGYHNGDINKHGTLSHYNHKQCRCEECRIAMKMARIKRQAK